MLKTDEAIDIWKKTIETQMHFNEMSTKSRQLGLTLVVAALGLSAVLIGRGDDFSLVVNVCSIPSPNFQLGLSREHPWTGFLCCCADNLTESLNLEPEMRGLASIHLQLAASKIQAGLYAALQNPAHVINN